MLPKNFRLNLKKDFKWVATGKKIEGKFLKMFIKLGDNQNVRVGIAVSATIFKKAVLRNKAKRLTAQAFQSIIDRLPKNINIVALPKIAILSVKSSEVSLDLEEMLQN